MRTDAVARYLPPPVIILAVLLVAALVVSGCATPEPPASPPPKPTDGMISAPLMVKLTLDDLTAAATNIIVGKVTTINSQWNAEHTSINTDVTLAVEQQVKGSWNQSEITVQVPGGQVGTVTQWVEDSPGFSAGEHVLVFLELYDNIFRVVGGIQGKFVIGDDGRIAGSDESLAGLIEQIKAKMSQTSR
ncbi:MAG: hypothetical protein ABIH70_08820 [Chloroflexota bacterium]